MNSFVRVACLFLASVTVLQPASQVWTNPALSPDKARRFDFWVGEWEVTLRIKQEDQSWKNAVAAEAHIFPILDGKGILELWDSEPIKGYSLRYYDPAKDRWVLWLNWPGKNRSGSSSLEGGFRHGRGEFYSRQTSQGEATISRYSFADITPSSLRWDDAYSQDGGRTWRENWIMEFTRKADMPRLPAAESAHTFVNGERCEAAEFRWYEFLAGRWEGLKSSAESSQPGERIVFETYKILDGCALMMLEKPAGDDTGLMRFYHLTFNTYVNRYELMTLDSRPGTPAQLYFGDLQQDSLRVTSKPGESGQSELGWHLSQAGDGSILLEEHAIENGEPVIITRARLTRN